MLGSQILGLSVQVESIAVSLYRVLVLLATLYQAPLGSEHYHRHHRYHCYPLGTDTGTGTVLVVSFCLYFMQCTCTWYNQGGTGGTGASWVVMKLQE